MDYLDFDEDLAHRAVDDRIGELCHDLGLANTAGFQRYPRRTPEDIALLCTQTAAPAGSGLPRWTEPALAH